MHPSSGLSTLTGVIALLSPISSAVSLRIVGEIDSRTCPFPAKATPLTDGTGFTLTYDTKGTSLASFGPSVSPKENSKQCYVYLGFEISENQRVDVESIDLDSPAKLDDGVQASVKTDFVWSYQTNWLQTKPSTKLGPFEGDFQANYTDDPQTYQSICQWTGPSNENNTNPLEWGVHVRTHFDLTGSDNVSGELGKDTTVVQTVKFKYEKPCDRYQEDDKHEACYIDREGYYLCVCGKPKPKPEDPMDRFGACDKWTRFPPDPLIG